MSREFILLKLLPALGFTLGLLYWLPYRGEPLAFFGLLLVIPLAFALTVVNLARMAGFWRWNAPGWAPLVVWSGYSSLCFALIGRVITLKTDAASLIECALTGFLGWGAVATLFDIFAMDGEIIEVYNRAYYKKSGTIASVGSYGPYFFGTFGFIAALLAKAGHYFLVESPVQSPLFIVYAFSALGISTPFTAYIVILRRKTRARKSPVLTSPR